MIPRPEALGRLRNALRRSPVVVILGARQVGKTTIARQLVQGIPHSWFDLELAADARALATPTAVLDSIREIVVIDEVQRAPELFPALRVLADRQPERRFVLLGSAAPELMKGASESLAGRVEFVDLDGFTLAEVGPEMHERLWLRGGFPRSFLAEGDADSFAWRENFIRTFLERDLATLSVGVPAPTLHRFWVMLAHYHGQTWNGAEIGRSLGFGASTVRRYLDILSGTFVMRQLAPWFENVAKRQVKAPKVYVRDPGLLHALLGIEDRRALLSHPKLGASWEGFALEQVLNQHPGDPYFWATHGGAELDLLLLRRARRWGFELKHTDAPTTTKSMHVALEDLRLDHLWVIYPGTRRYPLAERITAVPLTGLSEIA